MQVKSIAECSEREHSAILSTCIELPYVIKIFDLSISEWPFYTGFTVCAFIIRMSTVLLLICLALLFCLHKTTVLPAKSDSDIMFCLQSYQDL